MNRKSDLEMKARKGEHAERLLKDPLIAEALSTVRQNIYDRIAKSDYNDKDDRENLYYVLKAAEEFEKFFTDAMRGGRKARSKLKELIGLP